MIGMIRGISRCLILTLTLILTLLNLFVMHSRLFFYSLNTLFLFIPFRFSIPKPIGRLQFSPTTGVSNSTVSICFVASSRHYAWPTSGEIIWWPECCVKMHACRIRLCIAFVCCVLCVVCVFVCLCVFYITGSSIIPSLECFMCLCVSCTV